jgi:hypothetical protein
MRHSIFFVFLLFASVAAAQDAPPRLPRFTGPVTNLDLLLATQATLHTVDMLTTAYDLGLGGREANPVFAPMARRPMTLAIAGGAIDLLQAYVITKIAPRHRKLAHIWAAGLVVTKGWATINNINTAGELQRRRASDR